MEEKKNHVDFLEECYYGRKLKRIPIDTVNSAWRSLCIPGSMKRLKGWFTSYPKYYFIMLMLAQAH